jgi:hypothetical protein
LADDEECILWSGVKAAVAFLRDDKDHSSAGGREDTIRPSLRTFTLIPLTDLDFRNLTEIMSWKLEQKQNVIDSSLEVQRSQISPNFFSRSVSSMVRAAGRTLYNYLPNTYHRLRSDGYQTFLMYSSKYSNGSLEVIQDLALIEQIWNKFPSGVSSTDLREFMKVENLNFSSF